MYQQLYDTARREVGARQLLANSRHPQSFKRISVQAITSTA
jgi:hypothetical protein